VVNSLGYSRVNFQNWQKVTEMTVYDEKRPLGHRTGQHLEGRKEQKRAESDEMTIIDRTVKEEIRRPGASFLFPE